MTKAEHILSLYDGKRSTSDIAAIVGCRPEYVRVVARQRKGTGYSDIDRRYVSSTLFRSTRRARYRERMADPKFREQRLKEMRDYFRSHYQADPKFRERHLERAARYKRRRKAEAGAHG